ncbi:hypothetical protein NE865_14319 [Phthorimaea operculella]|nr:hypothetical protein NE865_14319 [Phthorimaea operculella]
MTNCKKCKQYIAKAEKIKCKGKCGTVFHKRCAAESKLLSEADFCADCAKEHARTPKQKAEEQLKINLETATPGAVLVEVNKKLNLLVTMKTTLDELATSVDFYAKKYDELVANQDKMDRKVVALEQKNVNLDKQSKALEERISFLESKCRERNIEISGLQPKAGENIRTTVENLAKKLDLDPSCIAEVMRVGPEKMDKQNKPLPRPVVITFVSVTARSEWMTKKKKLRLVNNDVYGDDDSTPIFFNEDLTKQVRQLLWYTKSELKSAYRYIWVQNGKILIRKDDPVNNKIYTIRSEDDVNNMKQRG